jgi:predicted nucleotidyltransferase
MSLEGIKRQLMVVWEKHPKVIAAYLFGSKVAGDISPLSDYDFAVLLENDEKKNWLDEKFSLYSEMCRTLKTDKIDIVVLNALQNEIIAYDILTRGVLLYDSNSDKRIDFEVRRLHRAIDFRVGRSYNLGFF